MKNEIYLNDAKMSSVHKASRFLAYSTPVKRKNSLKSGRSVSGSETDVSTSNENLSHEERYVIQHTPRQEPQGQENLTEQGDPYDTLIIHNDPWNQRIHNGVPPPMYKAPAKEMLYDPSVREITDIPDDYLSQSQVLKHLAKEVKTSGMESGGESDQASCGAIKPSKLRKTPLAKLSKSQPDLSTLSCSKEPVINIGNTRKEQQRCALMVERLLHENTSLKLELETCYHRVAKAHKLEEEVGKVTAAHEDLVAQCERRERLEAARIGRLQAEVRRLQEANQRLAQPSDHARQQLAKREALIAQLVQQNKELVAQKERQEIELAAQRATLQEQRTHIDILDTALINAQANVVRLEEECRHKQVQAERVQQLQRALSSLQLASDRREQTERKLRLQLEQELKAERAKHSTTKEIKEGNRYCRGPDDATFREGITAEMVSELKRELRERDEKIMKLEGETAKWEQKYLEESQLRQAAIEAASIPKDAKIAALEKTSQETEKLIAEARSDRIRQMDEVHAAQKRITDLEAKVKEVECKLAEKDAMIRVLQNKHTLDKEVSSSYPSISLGSHHTHNPSLNPTDLNLSSADQLGGVSTQSVFSSVSSSGLTGSTGFGSSSTSIAGDSYHHKYSTPCQSYRHKSLDQQLQQLDSHLHSKRTLCCFPGFSHPGASARKGKIPQSLLAGVDKGGNGGGEEMALVEAAGRSCQAQRGGSLPPSSLPRPRGRDRAYARLSDDSSAEKHSSADSGVEARSLGRGIRGALARLADQQPNSGDNEHSSGDSGVEARSLGRGIRGALARLADTPQATDTEHSSDSGVEARSLGRSGLSRLARMETPPASPTRKVGEYTRLQYSEAAEPPQQPEKKEQKKELGFSKIPRSYIPPPRKLSDYTVFSNSEPKQDPKIGFLARRGSLHRDPPKTSAQPQVRSLPATNKYRIQF